MVFRYPEEPSRQVREDARKLRKRAFCTLNRKDVFEWKGPSLYPSSLASHQNTANPGRRVPVDILLSEDTPAYSEQDHCWTLTLLEALWEPEDPSSESSSQVWRCRAQKRDSGGDIDPEMTVVLKLYLPGIYRHGFRGMRWTNELGLSEGEAIAYERFKSIQGIDVPFCYGFYNFDSPVGPSLIGVVLEDLTSIGKDLHTYTERLTSVQPKLEEQMKYIDHIFCENIRTCHRLNSFGISLVGAVGGSDIFVLRPLPTKASPFQLSQPTKIVYAGFGHTYTEEEAKEEMFSEEFGEASQDDWLYEELSLMTAGLSNSLGDERIEEWREMEKDRKLMLEYSYFC